jgi:hypothetical protein
MKTMKLSALFAASVTGLVMSSALFAADSTAYKEAVSAAKSEFKSAVATCKDGAAGARAECMKDAESGQKLAMDKAREMRGDAQATRKIPQRTPDMMNKESGDKMMQDAGKPIDKTAPAK